MSKKLLRILQRISTELGRKEFESEDVIGAVRYDEADLADIGEELESLEFSDYLEEDDLDLVKALLAYVLMRESSFGKEEIFSWIFGRGRRIIWN